jgi:autotransporter-associated beta strand protein
VGRAADLFWDSNGNLPGAGAAPAGIWGTDAYWNDLLDGTGTSGPWIAGSTAIFSAGTDATTGFTVNIIGNQTAARLVIEEGFAHFTNGAVVIGAGNVTVNSGATLSTDSSLRITATAGATMNVDGGTLRTSNPGAAGTFYDQDFAITIGPGGATLSHITPNILNIVQTPTTISGPGGVIKNGLGVLAIAGTATYLGPTVINDGELRIRTTANRLPVTTAVAVNNPGILNLNGVSQQIGSLTGAGLVGLGSGTLTVGDATDTTFTGAIRNIANAGAAGVTTGNGRLIKTGPGSLTLTASNHYSGSLTISNGAVTAASGSVLCDAICDVVVHGGSLNLSNASQTVLSLSGSNGVVNLGSGHVLTVNPTSGTRSFFGTVAGDGTLRKTGAGTLGLFGNNTFDSATAIEGGAILAGSATALGSAASPTTVASGASLLFDGPTLAFEIAEPVSIAGIGSGALGSALFIQNSANITVSGPVTLTGDATIGVSGSAGGVFTGPISSPGNYNLTLQGGAGAGAGGLISGPLMLGTGGLTKLQGGTWTIASDNSYSGPTVVSAGRLRVANSSGSATGSGAITIASGASIAGPGSVAGSLTVDGTLAPGTSPGTLATGPQTWNGGASYQWEINGAAGAAGLDPGWDLINVTGGLTISATPANKFNINIISLNSQNEPGEAGAFDNTFDYSFTILTTTAGITGFDPAAFNVNAAAFSNALGNAAFVIELANGGNDLVLHLLQKPIITAQPASQIVTQGDDVLLSVVASGAAPLNYTWRKDGVVLPSATASTLALDDILPSQAGGYDVIVANAAGSVTSTVATVTVRHAPIIAAHPQNTAACPGGTATFNVSASGVPAVAYQWRFGGTDLLNQTNATLVITNVQTANAGNYDVVVTNELGSATSNPAALTVNSPTTATPLAGVTNACPASVASFATTAGGTGPFAYVWRKDGTVIAGEGAATLNVTVTPTSGGNYCVEVAGACGSVTNCAPLTVATAPTIATQPQNQTVPMGNSATFSVTAPVTAPLGYQWQRNGSDITGATSSTLVVPNVTLAQSGEQYRVVVTNCAGTVTSASATLTVTPIAGISFDFNTPGQFTNVPYNVQINEWLHGVNTAGQFPPQMQETTTGGVGGSGALDIFGAGDMQIIQPQTSYDFSLNGQALVASTWVRVVAPTSNQRMTQIGFVTTTNLYAGAAPGLISAGISDNNPQGFMTVIMQSTAQPALTYQLRLQHRRTTGSIAEVTPTPTPQATLTAGNWYKLVATFQNIKGTVADNFAVSASLQDMGANGTTPGAIAMSYTATNVNNPDLVNQRNMFLALRCNGTATGADMWDNIHAYATPGSIYFVTPPETQTVAQGDQATFRALVDGEGPYSYQWSRNGTPIPGARNWKYITPPTTTSDNGAQYTVAVTGPGAGNVVTSTAATLTVTPETLAVVSAGSVDGCLVGVRFNQPVDRATAENPANYLINGVAPTVARLHTNHILPDGRNGTSVILTPASILSGAFTVTVQGVQDLSGGSVGVNSAANGMVAGLHGLNINPAVALPEGANYSFAPGQFEVTGGGVDIFSAPDSFRYVHTERTGDFDVKVRVTYQDVVRASGKAGFEVRASLDPGSPHVLAAVNPMWPARGLYEGTFRQVYGSGGISWGAPGTPVRYPNGWLRLRRVGNSFIRYSSVDGVNWQNDGVTSPTPALPDTVLLGFAVCSAANGIPSTALFDSYGDFAGYAGSTIAITTQPVGSATVAAGSSTNLSVTATVTGAPANELTYVWQRNTGSGWVNLPTAGSTNNVLNTGPLFITDNGARYRVVVKAPGAADVTSSETTVTVTDTGVPTFSSATLPAQSVYNIVLGFSEPMSDTAANAANYTVTNSAGASMGVASATFLSGDRRTVVLTTGSPLIAGTYGISASTAIQDLAGNAIVATTRNVTQALTPPLGTVVIDMFTGLSNAPADITVLHVNPKFTGNNPDFILYSNVFGLNHGVAAFPNVLDNYGARIYSHFVAPTNGAYKFYIRGDDFVEFHMNTSGPDRAGATLQLALLANNAAYTAANSVTNTLVAGQRYYIELRYKETTGGDGGTLVVRNDNTVPAATEVLSGSLLAFPNTIAPATPVVVELYTGQVTLNSFELNEVNAAYGSGGYPDLLASIETPAFINRLPNVIGYEKNFGFNFNLNQGNAATFDNYLGRMYGYFVAPSNGLYKFYARSDDSSQLWMNTNAVNSTDPAGMVLLGRITDFYDVNYRLMAQNVALVGGQRYYIEGRWRDGTGGDGMTVAVRAQENLTTPPNTEIAGGNLFEFPTDRDRVGAVNLVGITPSNPVVNDGGTVAFMAQGISGALPYGFAWLKNGQPIAGNSANFTTQPLSSADNGTVFTLVVTNGFSRVERSSTVTVISDSTAPTIVSAVGSQYQDTIVVTFSEPVDEHTACGPVYAINNGLRVLSASYDSTSRRRVTLRTTPQTPGTTYTITVNGVKDTSSAGNTIAANSTARFTGWIAAGSGVYVEIFTNIAGTAVANLTNDNKFINNLPDVTFHTNRFGAGIFGADTGLNNYGARVSGYFVAPSNGLYRFYIRGDDGTQLFMNTNGPDASGRVLIARNDGANSGAFDNGTGGSASTNITLNAGTLYYIEALMKEGGGGDHVEVAHRAVDPASNTPIGGLPPVDANQAIVGQFFVNVGNPDTAALTVAQAPPATLNVVANDIVTLEAWAYAPNFALSQASAYQWQRSDGGGGFTNVPGAIGRTFSFQAKASDAGIRLIASGPGTNAVYTTALNVASDTRGPVIVAVSTFDGSKVAVTFSEPLPNTTITDEFNYGVNGQVPITAVAWPDPNASYSTRAVLTPLNPLGATFTVDAVMTDDANNTGISATNGVTGAGFLALDVGAPVAAGQSVGGPDGDIDVIAGGNDIWGNSDVGHLTLGQRSGNFDVSVRVAGLTRPDAITKAGLMVRETLDANSRTLYATVNPSQLQLTTNVPGRDLGEAGRRQATGGATAAWPGSVTYNPTAVPNAWIRLKRVGDQFTAMRSYDGVNWLTYASSMFGYPNTVYVGLATTAHTATQAPGLVTLAEYRDLYVVPGPVILVQPSPPSQTVPLHSSVSYSVVASNPPPNVGPLTYQWFRNGIPISGATNSTFNIPDATGADNGVYTVDVSNDGGTVTSDPVSLTANSVPVAVADSASTVQNTAINIPASLLLANDSDPEGAPLSLIAVSGIFPATFNADFESGVPAGANTFGGATALPSGGVNNSGALRLNTGAANQSGSMVLDELSPGRRVTAFNANFKLRISDVSNEPADGFSFNFAPDLTLGAGATLGENGVGTGISFCVDNYRFMPYPQGGLANTSGLKVRYRGADIAGARIPTWNSSRYVPVSVAVTPEGVLTVLVDGTNVFGNIVLPNYVPTAGRFGFYGRTGGEFQSHTLDDISITSVLTMDTMRDGTVVLNGSQITYTPATNVCGADAFYYLVSDGQQGGVSVGTVNVQIDEANPAPPVITQCATNRNLVCAGPLPDLRGEIVATDNCCCVTITQDPAPGTMIAHGSSTTVTFTVTDTGGRSANCQAVITVSPSTLAINSQPANQAVFAGDPANFSVTATGQPVLTYQWRLEGADIAGATASTLNIPNAQAANAGNYTVVVRDGCSMSVTSMVATLTILPDVDFGDAPAPYPVLLANNGARHLIVAGFHLGTSVDREADGQPSATANGDGTDENGVVGASAFIRGQTASADVMASAAGRLDAWIDWNADGDWADAGEKVANNAPLNAGVNTLPVPVPVGAAEGPVFVRLRFSSAGGLSFDGQAADGEVEDYVILIENRPPLAVDDSATTGRNQVLSIPAASLLANDTDPNGDPLIITAVSATSARGGTVTLSGGMVTYTPPAGFVGSDSFTYTIADKPTGGLTDTATVCVIVSAGSVNLAFQQPLGGWTYAYDGSWTTVQNGTNVGGYRPNVSLDGSWSASNGSSEWAGDARGAGNGPLGGISTNNGIVTVEDVNIGTGTGNNRKIYFTRDFANDAATTNAARIMDGGITIAFRARLTQADVVPATDITTNTFPDGWGLFSDGKAHFNVRSSGDDSIVGFSLVRQTEPDNGFTFPAAGLTMNRLNGDAPSANVDSGDAAGGVTNVLALDPNVFHEFWITIRTNDATAGNGTHVVNIFVDGANTPATFNITAGNGDEANSFNATNFLAFGLNNSGGRGGLDVDFFAYKQGVITPGGFSQLQIVRQGNNLVLSWPVSCGNNFVLEETPSLQPGSIVWTPVAGAPAEVNGRNQLTVPNSGQMRFYRLRQP